MLYGGYVEEASLGCLVLWHPEGFDTVEDAFCDLAAAFREVVEKETKLAHERARRWNEVCPHCEKPLAPGDPLDVGEDEVADRIKTAILGIIDGSGELWDVLMDGHGWKPSAMDMPREFLRDAIVVHENAETLLGELSVEESGGTDWEHAVQKPESLPMYSVRPEESE
jgi:hypothetical protein